MNEPFLLSSLIDLQDLDNEIAKLIINYEAKNKIIEYTVGKSLEKITNYLVKSFVSESNK